MRVDAVYNHTLLRSQSTQSQTKTSGFFSTLTPGSMETWSADGANQSILDGLSDSSKAVLKSIKENQNDITEEEWMRFMEELSEKGAVSSSDYNHTNFTLMMVPIGKNVDGQLVLFEPEIRCGDANPHPLLDSLEQIDNWPGNPLENLELWALSLTKWKGLLLLENGSVDYSPIDNQIDACMRVSRTVKELAALL